MQSAQQLVKDSNNFFIKDQQHYDLLQSISRRITEKNLQGNKYIFK